jgi:hypothetical protein
VFVNNVQSNQIKMFYLKSVHFITIQHKLSMTISTQRGTGCRGPEVKTQKCMHKYYPDMYLILYCMTCFIVLYLIYVMYYACQFEKLGIMT